ncbi:cytochrome P450 [Sphingobium subterraneum]|uniref:Cytochrome P450 n=1 Tax=Sphingobium subterraneum TaxID=627688 RepID=A0A841J3S7_9SPHN|nr:cytochrome P450 [Sphingobium subterraneum]MBB6125350.1 cytochrome P450 [Sphingobium subterraneum]
MQSKLSGKQCPIDHDHESRAYASSWPDQYREMRSECPIAWSKNHGGYWVASRYRDIVAIAQASDVFRSNKTYDAENDVVKGGVLIPPGTSVRGLPIETDRPEWDSYRSFINRKFAPKASEVRRERVRHFTTEMIDRVIETGKLDFVHDLTGPVPAMATMELMGLPLEEWREHADAMHEIVFLPKESEEFGKALERFNWVYQRCAEEFRRYRELPEEDNLLSYFAHGQIDGRPVTEEEALGYALNILAGGVDTTTSLTTHTLVYLYENPEERERLIAEPELLPTAREELVRYFSPMHGIARNVVEDFDIGDVKMEAGDRVFLPWSSGNRDPEIFDEPEKIDLARFPNRHIAFGAGMHRCIGSFMARVMFEEMLTQILERMPDYKVDVSAAERYPSVGTINGWINMPATFTPGKKRLV